MSDVDRALNVIQSEWKNTLEKQKINAFLRKLFPKAKLDDFSYDICFRFQKGSYICMKRTTRKELLVDCFSYKTENCAIDFSSFLRSLNDIGKYRIDSIGFEFEPLSLKESFLKALFSGGALLFIIPILIENLVQTQFKLIWYVGAALIYIIVVTVYFRRR